MTLQVRQLCKEYLTRSGSLPVLTGIDLEMQRGQALAVMGPSGSGKSTLLHILGTLDRPTSGTVTLANQDLTKLADHELADFRNRHVGFVFQEHHLLPQLTVLENVLLPTLVHPTARASSEAWAKELLHRVGLTGRLEHRPAELSGGERQRVAVARALIHRPVLLLADEPTGNLDRTTARAVGQLLHELHRAEQTILIVVTHSTDLAASFAQRAEMNEGRLHTLGGSA